MFSLETATALMKKHPKSTGVVLLVFGSAWVNLFVQYKNISEERIDFEKYRSDETKKLNEKEADLKNRDFVLKQREKAIQSDMDLVQSRVRQLKTERNDLAKAEQEVSNAQRQKDVEEKLEKMIGEFSQLGIDLDGFVVAPEMEEQKNKRKSAENQLVAIIAFSKAHGLCEKYKDFFARNGEVRACK